MKKLLVVAMLLYAGGAAAWNAKGHGIVALIAKSRVNAGTMELVNFYLDNQPWETVSCWMDTVKAVGRNDMRAWHFVWYDRDKTYVKTREPDLLTQLDLCISMLDKRTLLTKEMVGNQLRILMHLVGDAHQPLHCGYLSDKGGSTVAVTLKGAATDLHKAWDGQLISVKNLDLWDCSKVLMGMPQKEITATEAIDPKAWVNESRTLLPQVYDFKNGQLDSSYVNRAAPVIAKQLTRAGLRLAAVLSAKFKK